MATFYDKNVAVILQSKNFKHFKLHDILEEEVEEVFDDTSEEETSEEKGTEGASKTVFGKTTKEVLVPYSQTV